MTFDIPEDRRYLETHEWARLDGDRARIGISDFAQDELGDVVFVELPATGDDIVKGEEFGVIESIKAVSDLYAPVTGRVVDVNESLSNAPERVNEDPYGEGWMVEVELAGDTELDDLLSADEYAEQIR